MEVPKNLPEVNPERIFVEVTRMIARLMDDEMTMLDQENHLAVVMMLADEFPYLFRVNPSLFDMVCDKKDKFDFQMLYLLLKHRHHVENGTMSLDLANKQVTTLGHNKYIQPIMDMPGMKEQVDKFKAEVEERKEQKKIYEMMKAGELDEEVEKMDE